MAVTGAQARARVARAIWGYTLMDQRRLADQSGIKYTRLRAIMRRVNADAATLDELIALAAAAAVPEAFALDGFAALAQADGRIAALETRARTAEADRDMQAGQIEAIYETLESWFANAASRGLEIDPPPARGARHLREEDRPAP